MQSTFNESYKKYYKIIEVTQSLLRTKLDINHPDYEYFENHHIIPESLGGSNKKSNLVLLTPEEHYICHSLLPDFCEGESRKSMLFAWHLMKNGQNNQLEQSNIFGINLIGSKKYGNLKRLYSKENSGKNSPNAKKVYQLDKDTGEIIKLWDSVTNAITFFTKDKTIKVCSFSECARSNTATTSCSFCWAYEETLEETIKSIIFRNNTPDGFNINSKPVYQLDKNTGEIIKKWVTLSQATYQFKGIFGIASCARNIQKSAGNFCWAYEETLEVIQRQIKEGTHFQSTKGNNNSKARPIYQLDKDTGEIIKLWDYVLLASETLKINKGNMANCAIKNTNRVVGDFCWAYIETLEETIVSILKGRKIPGKKVYQLDKDTGEIIKLWDSVALATQEIGGNISSCARGKCNTAGDFCWAYEETLEETIKNIEERATL